MRTAAFSGDPCPPDIIGINYYVTSDRYLDHRLAQRADLVEGRPTGSLDQRARRPRFSALASERGWVMPTLEDAVERFVRSRERVLERTAPAAAQP